MRPSIGANGALLWLLAGPAAAQVNVEAVARFHSEARRLSGKPPEAETLLVPLALAAKIRAARPAPGEDGPAHN